MGLSRVYSQGDPSGERSLNYLADQLDRVESEMIDPREFGRLEAEVHMLRDEVSALRADVKSLLELANQSRGGFWVGMSVASVVGGLVTFGLQRLLFK